jgi:hypothetical protein
MEVRLIRIDKDVSMHAIDSANSRKTICGIDLKKVKYQKDASGEYLDLYRDITCPKCSSILTKRSLKEGRNDIFKETNKLRLEKGPKLVQLSELYNEDGTKKSSSIFSKKKSGKKSSDQVLSPPPAEKKSDGETTGLNFKEYKLEDHKAPVKKFDLSGLAPKPKAYEETVAKRIENEEIPPEAAVKVVNITNNNNTKSVKSETPPVTMGDLENVLTKLNNIKPNKTKKEFIEVRDIKIPAKVEIKSSEWSNILTNTVKD